MTGRAFHAASATVRPKPSAVDDKPADVAAGASVGHQWAQQLDHAAAARSGGEIGDRLDGHAANVGNYQLSNPHAAPDRHRLRSEIDQEDLHLTAIVGVNRTGGVQNRHAVLER